MTRDMTRASVIAICLAASVCHAQFGQGPAWVQRRSANFPTTNGYPYKMKIQFTGYDKTETLTNFPALVVFTNGMSSGTFQYSQFASTNGWDLWFANESGTELNYEIEQWGTNTNSYVWVQVPTFTNNCYIWAYWGDTNRTTQQAYTTNGATWSNGFAGVWHMKEATGATVMNSTATTGINGSPVNSPTQTAGKIDGALEFNGVNTDVGGSRVEFETGLSMGSGSFTMAAWINRDSVTGSRGIIGTKSVGGAGFFVNENAGVQKLVLGRKNATDTVSPELTITAGTWYHAAVVMNRTAASVTFYLNGVASAATSYDAVAFTDVTDRIGSYGNGEMFDGKIDDARISTVVRSSNWVWACYMNQASNTNFTAYTVFID